MFNHYFVTIALYSVTAFYGETTKKEIKYNYFVILCLPEITITSLFDIFKLGLNCM